MIAPELWVMSLFLSIGKNSFLTEDARSMRQPSSQVATKAKKDDYLFFHSTESLGR